MMKINFHDGYHETKSPNDCPFNSPYTQILMVARILISFKRSIGFALPLVLPEVSLHCLCFSA